MNGNCGDKRYRCQQGSPFEAILLRVSLNRGIGNLFSILIFLHPLLSANDHQRHNRHGAIGYTQLSVPKRIGSIQADICGINVVRETCRHIAENANEIHRFTIKGKGE